ncbi:DnaJ C-terminal domain-containing protein [Rubricoccus marinus]|uniref:J domain-containing protein n=1 Tax=Rubricoccus marinus TaxID=716817 RepID=A0A259U2Q3_9BACT|nr:DnaJ C-terminal domain-containing protein [Rubricoccus marinus]OZC04118.1 hypothetical protein BSZ36_14685 [Rubricoccus marinus]
MPAPDHYATLGVSETASQKEIKKAYRTLAQKYHPDRNAGDSAAENRFKEVQSAYDVVGDEAKRKEYDQMRRNPFAGRGGSPFGGGSPFSGGAGDGSRWRPAPEAEVFGADGLGDIFSQMFGGGGSPFGGAAGGPRPGAASGARGPGTGGRDIDASMTLSFGEALEGGPSKITVPGGETLRITIPEGVRNGTKIRLKGRGDAGPSGARGDLYITFEVEESPRFARERDDLRVTESVSAVDAMLGTARQIETPYGQKVNVKIPAGTQPGASFRVRGQGVKTKKGRGDLFVEIAVSVPDLAEDARDGLREWAAAHGLA